MSTQLSIAEQWQQFRASYAPRQHTIDGVRWEYWAAGTGDRALLLLPGAPGRGETSFHSKLAFAGRYRVIAPSYPAEIRTAETLVDGLAALLQAEGIERAHVVGGSYSGLVAQCLLRRHPALVDRLVLSVTGVPNARRARYAGWLLRYFEVLPFDVVRTMLKMTTYAFVRPPGTERRFWRQRFHTLLDSLSRADVLSRLAVVMDIDARYSWTPWEADSNSVVLVLTTTGDAIFGTNAPQQLRALYPHAIVRTMLEGGHIGSLTVAHAYIDAIGAFLAEADVHP